MKIARKQVRYETMRPFLSVFADGAAFSIFRWIAAMRTGHTDIAGVFFIVTNEQEMLARKLVIMPVGMLAFIKTFPYRMVEFFHFWGLKDA